MIDLKHKKFCRLPQDGLVFGVAAGLGRYFEVDTVFVRIAILALTILTHNWLMPVLYIMARFMMPVDPTQDTVAQYQEPKDVTPEK